MKGQMVNVLSFGSQDPCGNYCPLPSSRGQDIVHKPSVDFTCLIVMSFSRVLKVSSEFFPTTKDIKQATGWSLLTPDLQLFIILYLQLFHWFENIQNRKWGKTKKKGKQGPSCV